MPSLPPPIKGELFYDGVWNSASVRTTSDIEITRGLTSESDTSAEPMETSCDLESGRDMLYAPRNPESPLYGKIGRNTPFRLSLEAGGPYLKTLQSGSYGFNTPDNDAFDFTGDIDIRVDCRPDDWTNPEALTIRYEPGIVTHAFAKGQDGFLYFWWTGTGTTYAKSTGKTLFANGERNVLRVTLVAENADGDWEVRFWHSKSIDADEWTMIGDVIVGSVSGTRSVAAAPLELGYNVLSLLPDSSSGFDQFVGEIYGMQMWDGINDLKVLDLDIARDGGETAVGGTSLTDATGFTWTRSGSASSLTNQYYRSVGEIPAWPPSRDLTGNAVLTSIAPTGITRRMDSGNKPIDSALLRWLTQQQPNECWPMTDGSGLQQGYSLVGGTPIALDLAGDGVVLGEFGKAQQVDWIEPTFQTIKNEDNVLTGLLPRDTSGDWAIDMVFNLSGNFQSSSAILITDEGAGSDASPQVQLRFVFPSLNGGTGLWVAALWTYNDDGGSSTSLIWSPNSPAQEIFDGESHHIRIQGTDAGGSVDIDMYLDGEFRESGSVPFTMKPLRSIEYGMIYNTGPDGTDTVAQGCGFLTFWAGNSFPSASEFYDAYQGFPGEKTSERITRLCAENNYTVSISGDPEEEATLSLQERKKLLELLQDSSDANFGYLLERRDALEIYHRGQSTLWSQAPVFELDFEDGVIGAPFKPVDDDKLTKNDVTVRGSRVGSPSRKILEEGALSIQDPPNGVGRYDEEYDYILDSNSDIESAAYMQLHLGTYNGVRYTRITINLANKRAYAMLHKILRADIGDKIRLLNIPRDHGPGPVDVIIQGYSETIGPEEWSITFNCVPGEPWTAGQVFLDGEANAHSRLDTAGSVSGGPATTTERKIDLYTTAEFEWTSDLFDSPYDVRVGGEVVTVLGPAGPLLPNPLFDTNADSWGTQNGSSVWTDEVVHPDPRARGSLKVTPSGGFSAGGPLSDISDVGTISPGVQYAMGAWVYSPNGFSDFRAVADWYDAAGSYISTSGASPVVGTARKWVWVSNVATAPASANRYRLRIRYGAAATPSDIYYVWAARLTLATASTVSDTFPRTVASSWGDSDTGQSWSASGGSASDYSTNGSSGLHSVGALNSSRYTYIPVPYTDQDVRVNCSTGALAAGDSQYMGPVVRYSDFDNNYTLRVEFETDQSVDLIIVKRVGGVQTNIASVSVPWVHAASKVFGVRFRIDGSTLKGKAWPVAEATEPRQWQISVVDSDLPTGGNVGVRSTLGSSNSNTLPFTFVYDNFETVANQSFSAERSQNNVVKTHVTGEDARLAIPSYVQM
ncbi:minor tail protein [Streptomyces phage phiRKBJ001]|nr:minor tail protein [Streptomyces phage phiRKBJ001]